VAVNLSQVVAANTASRQRAAREAEVLLTEEQRDFESWRDSLATVPTIKVCRSCTSGQVAAEIAAAHSGTSAGRAFEYQCVDMQRCSSMSCQRYPKTARLVCHTVLLAWPSTCPGSFLLSSNNAAGAARQGRGHSQQRAGADAV